MPKATSLLAYHDLQSDETHDGKVPVYPEESFQSGIHFKARV